MASFFLKPVSIRGTTWMDGTTGRRAMKGTNIN